MPETESWSYQRNCLIPPDTELPKGMNRIAAVVEYDGSVFCGWQRQRHCDSVQRHVEGALSSVAAENISVVCAGRTDTGVHGTNQVIHFDTVAERKPRNWILGANANLPDTVRLHWARQMPPSFHARFSATARTYRYIIANGAYRPALFNKGLSWERRPLCAERMQTGAACLPGEQDFSSFRAAGCQSNTPYRNIHYVEVWRSGDLVVVEIRANAFLHHMVRNIAGALIAVGCGAREPQWIKELLIARDRTMGAVTAPANGLYLVAVDYPDGFELPGFDPGPYFVSEPLKQ